MLCKNVCLKLFILLGFFIANLALLPACQWAGGAPHDPIKSQSETPRPEWLNNPTKEMSPTQATSRFFVEKKRYVTDLSYGLKQAQSAALQKHPGGQILNVYWEQRQDYTIWVLLALPEQTTP